MRILIFLLASLALWTCQDQSQDTAAKKESESFTQYMSGNDTSGYKRAEKPRTFTFPGDHGPHDGFKTEWWYITGNVEAGSGERFGYQITFFKTAVSPDTSLPLKPWAFNHIYMAHLGISDINNKKFYSYERFQRATAGLAGATQDPFKVWLENWQLAANKPLSGSAYPVTFMASTDEIKIELDYEALKEPVLQGEQGLSQKGRGKGNASYYYSYSRLKTKGTFEVEGRLFDVEGLSWLDREWSTSALEQQQAGWDWFALQLDNGVDIMYYQLRFTNGDVDSLSRGSWVNPGNGYESILYDDVQLTPLESWTSDNGASYPVKWRMNIPDRQLDITINAVFNAQEHGHTFRYWEGAVDVNGTLSGTPVVGRGYLEMTGY